MDRFEAMSAFVAVVDHNGFAPAARRLGLSPSGVTRLVAALEEHLGITLLRRTTRSMTLTDAGARYLERARRILSEVAEAESSAQAERLAPSGRLIVSAPVSFGRMHVAPLMADYLKQHPDVSGELMLSDRFVNLVEEGYDLALRIGFLADSSLVARRIGATRRIVVAAPSYLKRRGTPQTPDDLHAFDTISFRGLGDSTGWRFAANGIDHRVTVASRYATNSADSAIRYAADGGGLAQVLAYQAADAIREKRLTIVLQNYERPAQPIQFVYPASRLLSAKVRTFVDLALATRHWDF
ncbi:LysR family transcriptional regulator [Afipia sp. P52-10]|jgi:DNA-binding transcriptional LysR family regulator|uniref:LysR family transcriptional regulator n=1 Tax=Afipia sp. P52-10 TaxID=1429916 RepID=UPI0003DF0B79|nr:LysR family transcriptional regulator [Afipia sp. P52-10]ETR77034.1 LysR family transcriptional regulator [Afipia sp. P52-10]